MFVKIGSWEIGVSRHAALRHLETMKMGAAVGMLRDGPFPDKAGIILVL